MNTRWLILILPLFLCHCEEMPLLQPKPIAPPPPLLEEVYQAPTPETTLVVEEAPVVDKEADLQEDSETEGLPPEIELEELRLIVRTLAEENRELKAALANIQASGEPPQATSSVSSQSTPSHVPSVENPEPESSFAKVLYVNPTWHYFVVNRGGDVGVKMNQRLSVTRDGVLIANGKITDVKPDQSVAEIDTQSLGNDGLYPKQGDRVNAR